LTLLYCNYGIKSIVYRNFVKLSEEIETEIWFVLGEILQEYGDFGDRLVDVSF